jgi:hypothetical protein
MRDSDRNARVQRTSGGRAAMSSRGAAGRSVASALAVEI